MLNYQYLSCQSNHCNVMFSSRDSQYISYQLTYQLIVLILYHYLLKSFPPFVHIQITSLHLFNAHLKHHKLLQLIYKFVKDELFIFIMCERTNGIISNAVTIYQVYAGLAECLCQCFNVALGKKLSSLHNNFRCLRDHLSSQSLFKPIGPHNTTGQT